MVQMQVLFNGKLGNAIGTNGICGVSFPDRTRIRNAVNRSAGRSKYNPLDTCLYSSLDQVQTPHDIGVSIEQRIFIGRTRQGGADQMNNHIHICHGFIKVIPV